MVAAVAVLEDISERVLTQKLLAGQRDVMAMIARGEPLETMLTEVVRVVEGISQRGAMASILLVSPDRQHLVGSFAPSLPEAYNEAIDGIPIGEGVGSCGTAAYRREPVIVTDIQTDPLWTDFRGAGRRARSARLLVDADLRLRRSADRHLRDLPLRA